MEKALCLVVILAVLGLTATAGFWQAVHVEKTNISEGFAWSIFVSCADGGNGEMVNLTGRIHRVYRVTLDAHGGCHVQGHDQPQDLQGIGATTGDSYQGVGVTKTSKNSDVDDIPWEETYVNNYKFIGQGPGNNFYLHETIRMTINANGEVTADVVNIKTSCK